MNEKPNEIRQLINEMRSAYFKGDNAMAVARAKETNSNTTNSVTSTLIAYDLQAGSYVDYARNNQEYFQKWGAQICEFIAPYINDGGSLLEIGVGEATTFANVLSNFKHLKIDSMGFDISWSRLKVANAWLAEQELTSELFVGDIFHIPLADNSVDVIYTSHSLEPNGGREKEAIAELLRVSRKAVVLVEPIYELASDDAKKRMAEHKYVRNLKEISKSLGANIAEYKLLDICANALNPSGVVLLTVNPDINPGEHFGEARWQCPITGVPLVNQQDHFSAKDTGIVYPVLKGIPLLRPEHGVVASLID